MVEPHRDAKLRQRVAGQRGWTAVAARLFHQARLIEQLVAVEHALLVPMRAVRAEIEPHAVLAGECARHLRRLALRGPCRELAEDVAFDDRGPALAPILPWEEAIPGLEV